MRKTAWQVPLSSLLAAAIASAPVVANAQPPAAPDVSPAPARPAREWTLALVQAGSALAVTTAATAALFAADVDGDLLLTGLAVTPAAAGVMVCALGMTSTRHDGRCLPTVGAAMLTLPVVLTLLLKNTHEDPSRHVDDLTLGAVFVLLPPLLATTSWHLFKRPKVVTQAAFVQAAPPTRALALYQPKRRAAGADGQVLVPLLATAF
jgi:hypothetical protein